MLVELIYVAHVNRSSMGQEKFRKTLHWRHNGHDSVSNHQPHDCLLNRLFRRRTKKISKLRVTGLCAGNSPETGEFPAQMASYAENVSIWWRHNDTLMHAPPTTLWINMALCSIIMTFNNSGRALQCRKIIWNKIYIYGSCGKINNTKRKVQFWYKMIWWHGHQLLIGIGN